ncbi:unnamed protein product, partial [Ascophyllum nodosum]
VNPYEWVSTVEDSGYLHEYGPELTGGLQEPVKKSCVATVTKGRQLDKNRGQESDRKEEPPDTLGSHLPAPQRELTSQDQNEDLEAK